LRAVRGPRRQRQAGGQSEDAAVAADVGLSPLAPLSFPNSSLVPKLRFGNTLFRNSVSAVAARTARNGVSQNWRSQTGGWERENERRGEGRSRYRSSFAHSGRCRGSTPETGR